MKIIKWLIQIPVYLMIVALWIACIPIWIALFILHMIIEFTNDIV